MSTATLTAKDKLIALFEKVNFRDNKDLRNAGKKAMENMQTPDRKNEDWKYTSTSFLLKNDYRVEHEDANIDDFRSLILSKNHLHVFIQNGLLQFADELPELKSIRSETQDQFADVAKNFFVAFNAANFTGGISLNVASDRKEILHIIHRSTENHLNVIRHRIHVQKNATAEVMLSFYSTGDCSFTDVVTEIICEENSSLKINILQQEEKNAAQYNHIYCEQKNNTRFEINTFTNGGEWIRNDLDIIVNGENCETHLNGLYLPKGKQHFDNHTIVDHKRPNCHSNEMYKGVMSDDSTAVFNGKVFVRPNAQKINAFQQNANILMSDNATVNSKPELEIYADDVKCSHGSTTGQLDEEALFYLRARGVGEENARKLLVHAFVNEVIERNSNEEIRNYLYKQTGLDN